MRSEKLNNEHGLGLQVPDFHFDPKNTESRWPDSVTLEGQKFYWSDGNIETGTATYLRLLPEQPGVSEKLIVNADGIVVARMHAEKREKAAGSSELTTPRPEGPR